MPFSVWISRGGNDADSEGILLAENKHPGPFLGVKTEAFRSAHKTAQPEGRGLFKALFMDSNRGCAQMHIYSAHVRI